MEISLHQAGKKYIREWIFRNADLAIAAGERSVILGPNGSGKSTMLQVLSGAVMLSEGSVSHKTSQGVLNPDDVFRHISFASPALELLEDFTLAESIRFHFRFRVAVDDMTTEQVIGITGLDKHKDKSIRYYSSGMKQRVKLALAFLTQSESLILDEPCSHLDASGIDWYKEMIHDFAGSRTVIIASNNNLAEYSFCQRQVEMLDYKK